jgi:hypothetical protein
LRKLGNVREKLAVVTGTVRAEVFKDLGEGSGGHRDGEEVIQ